MRAEERESALGEDGDLIKRKRGGEELVNEWKREERRRFVVGVARQRASSKGGPKEEKGKKGGLRKEGGSRKKGEPSRIGRTERFREIGG